MRPKEYSLYDFYGTYAVAYTKYEASRLYEDLFCMEHPIQLWDIFRIEDNHLSDSLIEMYDLAEELMIDKGKEPPFLVALNA